MITITTMKESMPIQPQQQQQQQQRHYQQRPRRPQQQHIVGSPLLVLLLSVLLLQLAYDDTTRMTPPLDDHHQRQQHGGGFIVVQAFSSTTTTSKNSIGSRHRMSFTTTQTPRWTRTFFALHSSTRSSSSSSSSSKSTSSTTSTTTTTSKTSVNEMMSGIALDPSRPVTEFVTLIDGAEWKTVQRQYQMGGFQGPITTADTAATAVAHVSIATGIRQDTGQRVVGLLVPSSAPGESTKSFLLDPESVAVIPNGIADVVAARTWRATYTAVHALLPTVSSIGGSTADDDTTFVVLPSSLLSNSNNNNDNNNNSSTITTSSIPEVVMVVVGDNAQAQWASKALAALGCCVYRVSPKYPEPNSNHNKAAAGTIICIPPALAVPPKPKIGDDDYQFHDDDEDDDDEDVSEIGFCNYIGRFDALLDTVGNELSVADQQYERNKALEDMEQAKDDSNKSTFTSTNTKPASVIQWLQSRHGCTTYVSTQTHQQKLIEQHGVLLWGPKKASEYVTQVTTRANVKQVNPSSFTRITNSPKQLGTTVQALLQANVVCQETDDVPWQTIPWPAAAAVSTKASLRGWTIPTFWESTTWPRNADSNTRFGFPTSKSASIWNDNDDDDDADDDGSPTVIINPGRQAKLAGAAAATATAATERPKISREQARAAARDRQAQNPHAILQFQGRRGLQDSIIDPAWDAACVFLSSPTCRTCRYLRPQYQRMARRCFNTTHVMFAQADATGPTGQALGRALSVQAVPTFVLFQKGKVYGQPLQVTKFPSPVLERALQALEAGKPWDAKAVLEGVVVSANPTTATTSPTTATSSTTPTTTVAPDSTTPAVVTTAMAATKAAAAAAEPLAAELVSQEDDSTILEKKEETEMDMTTPTVTMTATDTESVAIPVESSPHTADVDTIMDTTMTTTRMEEENEKKDEAGEMPELVNHAALVQPVASAKVEIPAAEQDPSSPATLHQPENNNVLTEEKENENKDEAVVETLSELVNHAALTQKSVESANVEIPSTEQDTSSPAVSHPPENNIVVTEGEEKENEKKDEAVETLSEVVNHAALTQKSVEAAQVQIPATEQDDPPTKNNIVLTEKEEGNENVVVLPPSQDDDDDDDAEQFVTEPAVAASAVSATFFADPVVKVAAVEEDEEELIIPATTATTNESEPIEAVVADEDQEKVVTAAAVDIALDSHPEKEDEQQPQPQQPKVVAKDSSSVEAKTVTLTEQDETKNSNQEDVVVTAADSKDEISTDVKQKEVVMPPTIGSVEKDMLDSGEIKQEPIQKPPKKPENKEIVVVGEGDENGQLGDDVTKQQK